MAREKNVGDEDDGCVDQAEIKRHGGLNWHSRDALNYDAILTQSHLQTCSLLLTSNLNYSTYFLITVLSSSNEENRNKVIRMENIETITSYYYNKNEKE